MTSERPQLVRWKLAFVGRLPQKKKEEALDIFEAVRVKGIVHCLLHK
jgi:hypothetical protein